jgi:hypothetical protein
MLELHKLTVFFYFLYCVNGQTNLYGCPPPTSININGCNCVQSWINSHYRITVQCNNFNQDELLFMDTLKSLNGYEIDELIINSYQREKLPDNVFTNALIRQISILNAPKLQYFSTVTSSSTSFFENLGNSLETIRIESSPQIREIEWAKFSNSLTNESVLRNIYIYNSYNSPPGSSNPLTTFEPFQNLTNIEKIVFRKNNMKSFTEDLSSFTKLSFLDLSENTIQTFGVTGSAPMLSTLFLNGNNIQRISEETLNFLPGLQFIDLTSNPFSCFCQDIEYILNDPKRLYLFRNVRCGAPPQMVNKPVTSCYPIRKNDSKSKTISRTKFLNWLNE